VSLQAPEPLSEQHRIEGFDCGVQALDDWLLKRALNNQRTGVSRTYVVTNAGQVAGYYCLSSGALGPREAPGGIRRNMPDPIPMAILGRLAVDRAWQGQGQGQGQGVGVALLRDAVECTAAAGAIIGIRGLLVHALSAAAAEFYLRYGFSPSPTNPLTLVMSLKPKAKS
jgi:GNAT superfamily N-acetyltransferase